MEQRFKPLGFEPDRLSSQSGWQLVVEIVTSEASQKIATVTIRRTAAAPTITLSAARDRDDTTRR
jgi:hypothetical protein